MIKNTLNISLKGSCISFMTTMMGFIFLFMLVSSCELIRMKKNKAEEQDTRKLVARVHNAYLYLDELSGVIAPGATSEDSIARITAYVNSWIRKQLVINEAMKNIDINEVEVERKILDYRYSLIAYEYQNHYISQHLDDSVSESEILDYYNDRKDNFILKQNIIQGTFIKLPKTAPRTDRVKELMYSGKHKDQEELKSYCISFSAAYHLRDSSWIEFDKLVANTPLAEIPNKVQFLKSYSYYEINDADYLYFLKIDSYKISDNVSPLEFVKQDIKNIILNKRKVELARKLEDEVYQNAAERKEFEIYSN